MEITGSTGADASTDERRRATASRIVIGREELDRMGDSSVGEVLKRLPGVTMGGPPGRGGGPRMRGMGAGYTLILIDGQRMPPGFSLDNIPPEQIERIEVMRAPVAEFSTRAIAGTINVIMRADYKRKVNDLRAGAGVEGSRPQMGGNWQRNGQTESIGWNTSLALMHGSQDNHSTTRTAGGLDDEGVPVDQQDSVNDSRGTRSALFGSGRLQFKLGPGHSLDVQPFVHVSRARSEGSTDRTASTPASTNRLAYTHADVDNRAETAMARLNGTWNRTTGSGGRLQVQLSSMLAQSDTSTDRRLSGGTSSGPRGISHWQEDGRNRDLGIENKGKYSQLLGERHSMSAGWELQHNTRNDWQQRRINGVLQTTPYGENVDATIRRAALFAQDEWEWNKQLSFYVGARWEAIETTGDNDTGRARNRSSVLTPLGHLVWKLDEGSRDQLRASITRSYRSPSTNQLVGRLNPTTQFGIDQPNDPLSPDRIGNPGLKPELAWNLDLALERYLEGGGILSVSAYAKRIDNLIRTLTSRPQAVAWSTAPRYVARPENTGTADAAGLEFEAKGKASEWWSTDLPLTLRANASLMWSRVSGVPGPDNRIDEQPPWNLNLGADWPLRGTPFTVGSSWSYTPTYQVRQSQEQLIRVGAKSALDLYAVWRVAPETSLRLSVNNALGRGYDSASTRFDPATGAVNQASSTRTRTYTQVNLRAELKF